jgi:hypothetical protein
MANFTEIAAGPWPKWAYNNLGLVVDLVLYVFFFENKNDWKVHFLHPSILQKYMVRKIFLQNYTSAPWGTASGTYRRAPRRYSLFGWLVAGNWC